MRPLIISLLLLLSAAAPAAAALPQPPDSLRAPQERAAWLMMRFWDDFDFSDCGAMADELTFGELTATYLSLFPHAAPAARREAADSLLARASTPCARIELKGYLEGYLLDRESPVADESLYVTFADAMLAAGYPDEATTRLLRRLALLGAEGTQAPDFPLTLRGEGETTFAAARGGVRTLLIFHDPACDECARLKALLRESRRVGELIERGELRVVAVYAGDDEALWRRGADIPALWADAFTKAGVDELYALPAMPTLYLIDADGTILRKDIDWTVSGGIEEALD